ncbi:MAG: Hsp20/alpha crystallin family protein [Deltaproteobacteria bacterium]|nr:Hsp20/alpha crystallin family protein [Deltaproteobacteria bacterium]
MAVINFPRFPRLINDPFVEITRMKREMDRLLEVFTGTGWMLPGSGVFPPVNIEDDGEKLAVTAELPGIKPEDMEISVEGNTLILKGERKAEVLEGVNYHRRERVSGRFHKAITLPYEVSADGVEAHYGNGVLRLALPKAEHMKARKIEVKAA